MLPINKNKQFGFTLIELILIILVIGIFFPLVLSVFLIDLEETNTPIVSFKASLLAEGLLDEISARQFDENSFLFSPPYTGAEAWTRRADLGLDVGENAGDKYTFDDVDDFINYSITIADADYGNFILSVQSIYYVSDDLALDDFDTELLDNNIFTGLKRVTIRVNHSLLGNQDFVSLLGTESAR